MVVPISEFNVGILNADMIIRYWYLLSIKVATPFRKVYGVIVCGYPAALPSSSICRCRALYGRYLSSDIDSEE